MTTIPIVDVEATGIRIRKLLDDANISIRELQDIMGFTTRNAIYKWTEGKCLRYGRKSLDCQVPKSSR